MDLKLQRTEHLPTGIFSQLRDPSGSVFAATVEHAYPGAGGMGWEPKLPAGRYLCVRGMHQLHSGPIETFEITGVPGHTGILFHPGNDQSASEGCVCTGTHRVGDRVLESRKAFDHLMRLQDGLETFYLTVE